MSDEHDDVVGVSASSESAIDLVSAADSSMSVAKSGDSGSENGVDIGRGSANGRRTGGSENGPQFDPADMVRNKINIKL